MVVVQQKKSLLHFVVIMDFKWFSKTFVSCQFLSNFTVLNWEKTFIIYVILCNAYIVGI